MKEQTIREQGQDVGLEGVRLKRFVHFFSNRFPSESELIHSYVREWARRFKGDPTDWMDKRSKDVYFDYFTEQYHKEVQ